MPMQQQVPMQPTNYAQFKRFSPFYLREHPQERQVGDIADIQSLAMSNGPNELQGVENVFEHNLDHFESLMEQSQSRMKSKKKLAEKALPLSQLANFMPMKSSVMPMN